MPRYNHVVVFDGTSAYVISVDDLVQEIKQNDVEVLEKFVDFNAASTFCDEQNESITDKVR